LAILIARDAPYGRVSDGSGGKTAGLARDRDEQPRALQMGQSLAHFPPRDTKLAGQPSFARDRLTLSELSPLHSIGDASRDLFVQSHRSVIGCCADLPPDSPAGFDQVVFGKHLQRPTNCGSRNAIPGLKL
jgi:hypothetical protein